MATKITVRGRPNARKTKDQKVQEFMETARKRFRACIAGDPYRRRRIEDRKFQAGEHWDPATLAERNADGRPCLVIDRTTPAIRQVTNAQRQSKPAIQINPVDSGADKNTAEVFQGIIRNIENNSDADIAYFTAADDQVTTGLGLWTIDTEYVEGDTFDQDIRINRVANQFTIYRDPAVSKFDWSDMRYAFDVRDMPKDEFEERFGEDKMATLSQFFSSEGNQPEVVLDWYPEGRVRVARYWYVETVKSKIALIELTTQPAPDSGSTDPIVERLVVPLEAVDKSNEGVRIIDTRERTIRKVKWALISGCEILEGNDDLTEGSDWAGKYIPIVPVIGEEINIEGKVDYVGMTRRARDPQRMKDYWASAQTESIALAPRAPYIGVAGQFENHEAKWNSANRRAYAYLEYEPVSIAGTLAPPPQRQQFEPAIQAINQAMATSENDIKAVTGFYDPSLGAPGNETSGAAILARQRQGETGSSNYLDNLGRSIRHTGRILIDLIPRIMDVPRVERIIGINDDRRQVIVHSLGPDQPIDTEALKMAHGVSQIYDLSVGRYDVTVSIGPSIQSRRQEAVQSMATVFQANPELITLFGDMWFENMDWPGASKMAERAKKLLAKTHPEMVEEEGGEKIPPSAMAKIQQLQTQLQEIMQAFEQAQQAIKTKQVEKQADIQMRQMDVQSKERIAELEAKVVLAEIQSKDQNSKMDRILEMQMEIMKQNREDRRAALDRAAQQRQAELAARSESNDAQGE